MKKTQNNNFVLFLMLIVIAFVLVGVFSMKNTNKPSTEPEIKSEQVLTQNTMKNTSANNFKYNFVGIDKINSQGTLYLIYYDPNIQGIQTSDVISLYNLDTGKTDYFRLNNSDIGYAFIGITQKPNPEDGFVAVHVNNQLYSIDRQFTTYKLINNSKGRYKDITINSNKNGYIAIGTDNNLYNIDLNFNYNKITVQDNHTYDFISTIPNNNTYLGITTMWFFMRNLELLYPLGTSLQNKNLKSSTHYSAIAPILDSAGNFISSSLAIRDNVLVSLTSVNSANNFLNVNTPVPGQQILQESPPIANVYFSYIKNAYSSIIV